MVQPEELAREVLSQVRTNILVNQRFLDMAVFRLKPQVEQVTLATDGEHLFYTPMWLLRRYRADVNQVNRAYMHVLLHCLFRHPFVNSLVDAQLWDLACDIAVESLITEMNLPHFTVPVEAKQQQVAAVLRGKVQPLTAEKLYHYFLDHPPRKDWAALFCADEHDIWHKPAQAQQMRQQAQSKPSRSPQNRQSSGGNSQDQQQSGQGSGGESQDDQQDQQQSGQGSGDGSQGDQQDQQQAGQDAGGESQGDQQDQQQAGQGSGGGPQGDQQQSGQGSGSGSQDSQQGNQQQSGQGSGGGSQDSQQSNQQQAGQDAGAPGQQQPRQGHGSGAGSGSQEMQFPQQAAPDTGTEYGPEQSEAAARQALEDEWRDISEHVAMDLETFSKQMGLQAGGMQQQLMELNRERYNYEAFLKKFAVHGEAMKINDDEFDYIFYTYGLKLFRNMPLIEPLEYKDVKRIREFVIAIDTSGSTSGELVQRFLQKTFNILMSTESFFSRVNVHVIQCDAEIQEAVKLTSQDEFEAYLQHMTIKGLGGTDFRPVFAYVDQLIRQHEFRNFRGLIYFTDGYGTFPERKPDYSTAFVFLRSEYDNLDVPPWAIKLILEDTDLEERKR